MTAHDSGDFVPLEMLLEHRDWVRALARSLVSDPHRADDVEQETWRMAIERPPRHSGALRSWFRVVVRNAARKTGRRARSVAEVEANAPQRAPVPSPADLVAQAELQHRLVRAVLALEEPSRSTVLYRFFEGLAPREIAARLGVPVETVRTRLKRGVERLRVRMDDELGADRRAWSLLLLGHVPEGGVPPCTAASPAAAPASLLGGLAMASLTKAMMVGAGILALALSVSWLLEGGGTEVSPEGAPAGEPPVTDVIVSGDGPKRVRAPTADAPAGAAGSGVDLDACDRLRDLHGVVLDDEGAPVGGARLVALSRAPWGETLRAPDRPTPRLREGVETTSAADGTFALRLEAGAGVGLRVEADGFALWESQSRQAGERLTVRLQRAAALDVDVQRADGSPAGGVMILLYVEPDGGEERRDSAATNPDGRVRFEELPLGSHGNVSLVAHSRRVAAQDFAIERDADADQSVEFLLPPTRVTRGTVVDAATGVGIGGAVVSAGTEAGVTANEVGRFEIDTYEHTHVAARAEGYARASAPLAGDVVIRLSRAAWVAGRIVNEAGEPVEGADVALIATSQRAAASRGGATTGSDGRFGVDGLGPEQMHLLRVEHPGYALLYRGTFVGARQGAPVDLGDVVLLAPRTLRGVVVDAEDRPVERLMLRLSGTGGNSDHVIHLRRATDDLGRFAFPALGPGDYEIAASRSELRRTFEVSVPRVGEPSPLTLRLVPEPPGDRPKIPVTATVRDEDGNPLTGVRLSIGYAANGGTPYTATDAAGRLSVEAEYEPAYVSAALSAEQKTIYLRPHRWLRRGERDITLVLRRGVPIAGRVVDAKGSPVQHASVEALDGPRQVAWATTNEQGRFAFAVPSGKPVALQARPPRMLGSTSRRVAEQRDVQPGADAVRLVIGPEPEARTLVVDVVDAEGTPVSGVGIHVKYAGEDHQRPSMGVTDEAGRAEIPDVPRAPATVFMYSSVVGNAQERWSSMPIRVSGDEDIARVVKTEPAVVRGRVLYEDGSPASGALVTTNHWGASCMTVTDDTGGFALRVPADAEPPLVVNAQSWPPDPKNALSGLAVVDFDQSEPELVLRPIPSR